MHHDRCVFPRGESMPHQLSVTGVTDEDETTAHSEAASLVILAAAGDQAAWSRLVDHYARLVWAVTGSFRLANSDASDVSQKVWLRLLEHIDRVDPVRVGAWL